MKKDAAIAWLDEPARQDYDAARKFPDAVKLIVADGFHRMCSVFSADEQVTVPSKIV